MNPLLRVLCFLALANLTSGSLAADFGLNVAPGLSDAHRLLWGFSDVLAALWLAALLWNAEP